MTDIKTLLYEKVEKKLSREYLRLLSQGHKQTMLEELLGPMNPSEELIEEKYKEIPKEYDSLSDIYDILKHFSEATGTEIPIELIQEDLQKALIKKLMVEEHSFDDQDLKEALDNLAFELPLEEIQKIYKDLLDMNNDLEWLKPSYLEYEESGSEWKAEIYTRLDRMRDIKELTGIIPKPTISFGLYCKYPNHKETIYDITEEKFIPSFFNTTTLIRLFINKDYYEYASLLKITEENFEIPEEIVQKEYLAKINDEDLRSVYQIAKITNTKPQITDSLERKVKEILEKILNRHHFEDYQKLSEITDIKLSEEEIQEKYSKSIYSANEIRKVTGVSFTEENIRYFYDSTFEKHKDEPFYNLDKLISDLRKVSEITETEIPEDMIQREYQRFLSSGKVYKYSKLREALDIEPNQETKLSLINI